MDNDAELNEVADELAKFDLDLIASDKTYARLKEALAAKLNHLITNDFSRLISILYRLDISESRLTSALNEASGISAGEIIADMIIKRQMEKIEVRKNFKRDNSVSDEESW